MRLWLFLASLSGAPAPGEWQLWMTDEGCWSKDVVTEFMTCCNVPPRHRQFSAWCFDGEYTYERCCDWRLGPQIRSLPVLWTSTVELHAAEGRPWLTIRQSPHERALDLWANPEGDNMCLLWDDSLARLFLTSDLASKTAGRQAKKPRLLDLAAGVGATAIAAAKRGFEVVAVDNNSCAVRNARWNARVNNASVQVANFHVCSTPEEFEQRFGGARFDAVATGMMGVLAASGLYDCIFELVDRVGAPGVRVYIQETTWARKMWQADRLGHWRNRFRRVEHLPLEAYDGNPYLKSLHVLDVWSRVLE